MIRGAGRFRMDERGVHHTPGEDRVRDGRHLMPQEGSEEHAPRLVAAAQFRQQPDIAPERRKRGAGWN